MIAEELDLSTVIIPRTSSVLCALGMVLADLRHDYVRAHRVLWSSFDADVARGLLDGMLAKGAAALDREGVEPSRRRTRVSAEMRYVGQHHEVGVEFPLSDLETDDGTARIESAFHARHEQLYGFSAEGRPLEIISLHATVLGERDAPGLELELELGDGGSGPTLKGDRLAWLPASRELKRLEVHDGHRLAPGQVVEGPAIVERATTTVLVPERFTLTVDRLGSLLLRNERVRELIR
jgi:N-methylhydantoinase A